MFTTEIIECQKLGNTLFYSSSGNPQAYRLNVKHISFAPILGYGKIFNNCFKVEKEILIVDFEKEQIIEFEVGEKIKVIDLESLE